MGTEAYILITTGITIILFVLGSPVVICLGLWVSGVSLLTGDISAMINIGQTTFYALASFALLAMPLFVLTGDFVLAGGIARSIARFALAAVGFIRGALAISSIFASAIFAAISGSNSGTAATIARMMFPEMKTEGYDESFAAATCASGGVVGIIIPPSVLFIMYGTLLNVSIGDLFIGGFIPGIFLSVSMALVATLSSRRNKWGNVQRFSSKRLVGCTWDAKYAFLAILLVLPGIYAGWFSPTEAASVAVFYCAFIAVIVNKKVSMRDIPTVIFSSAKLMGILAPLIAFSIIMQQLFSIMGVTHAVQDFVLGIGSKPLVVIVIMGLIFFTGCVLESLPVIVIWAPILAPVAYSIGFDPIHFGVWFMVGIAIGFITPPYGLNLFVVSGVTGISYITVAKKILPYIAVLLLAWVIIIILPQLVLFPIKLLVG